MEALPKKRTLGVDLSTGTFAEHVERFAEFGADRRSSYVCCVNAHMTVEAHNDPAFAAIVNGADAATADQVKALQNFVEDLREGLGIISLYNESLGSTNEVHLYDRVKDRDFGVPKRPWER